MSREEIREETKKRLAELDIDLSRDEAEIERQMPDVQKRMIEEAEIAARHYRHIAEEAITDRYRELYKAAGERWMDKGERIKKVKL